MKTKKQLGNFYKGIFVILLLPFVAVGLYLIGSAFSLHSRCHNKQVSVENKLRNIVGIENIRVSDDQCHITATVYVEDKGDITFIDLYPEAFDNSPFMWIRVGVADSITLTPLSLRLAEIERSKKADYPYGNKEELNNYRVLSFPLHNVQEVINRFDDIRKAISNDNRLEQYQVGENEADYYFVY